MSRQSDANNASINAKEELRALLPYRSTVYYTILSHSRSGDTLRVQFLIGQNAVRDAKILNISHLIALATLEDYDSSYPGSLKLHTGGYTPTSLIQSLGRRLHGDESRGDIKPGHADHEWFYIKDTLA